VILRQQNIAGMNDEGIAASREFQDTSQCDDVLRDGVVLPGGMARRLLEMDGFRLDQLTAADAAHFHMGISVGPA
jgi:hypothetical protein